MPKPLPVAGDIEGHQPHPWPGIGLGAVMGSICLLLGLLSMSALPIHLGGVLLLILGLIMLGLFLNGVGWNLAFVAGSALLTDALSPAERMAMMRSGAQIIDEE